MQKFFPLSAILISVGYTSSEVPELLREILRRFGSATFDWTTGTTVIAALVAPLLPLFTAVTACITTRQIPRWLAYLLATLVMLFGSCMTILVSLLADTGVLIVFIQGLTLTAASAGAILILSRSSLGQKIALILLTAPTIVAIWSIGVVGLIAVSATSISEGRPYCLTRKPARDPIGALQELRGLSFYTSREWSFHGLLVVQDADGQVAYNWSPRRMRFDPVLRPKLLFPDPRSACIPKKGFLGALPLI